MLSVSGGFLNAFSSSAPEGDNERGQHVDRRMVGGEQVSSQRTEAVVDGAEESQDEV